MTTTPHSKIWKSNGEERVFSTALAVVSDYVLDFCLERDFDDSSRSAINLVWRNGVSGAYESNDHFQLGWCAHACSAHYRCKE